MKLRALHVFQSRQKTIERGGRKTTEVVIAFTHAVPIRHEAVYVDPSGFRFDRNGMLIDGNGYPITINDDGSMVVLPR